MGSQLVTRVATGQVAIPAQVAAYLDIDFSPEAVIQAMRWDTPVVPLIPAVPPMVVMP